MPTDNKIDRIARELAVIAPTLNLRERRRHARLIEQAVSTAWSARTARASVTRRLRAAAQVPAAEDQLSDLAARIIATCGRREWSARFAPTSALWRRWLSDPDERFILLSRRLAGQMPQLERADTDDMARALAAVEPGTPGLRIDIRTGDYSAGRQLSEIAYDYLAGPEFDGGYAVLLTPGSEPDQDRARADIAARFDNADVTGRSVVLRSEENSDAARDALRIASGHPDVPCIVVSPVGIAGGPAATAVLVVAEPTAEGVVRLLLKHLRESDSGPIDLDPATQDSALEAAKALPASLWSAGGSGEMFLRSVARRIAERTVDGVVGADLVRDSFEAETAQWRIPVALDEGGRRKVLRVALAGQLTGHTAQTVNSVADVAAQIDPTADHQRLAIVGHPGSGATTAARTVGWEVSRSRGGNSGRIERISVRDLVAGEINSSAQALRIRSAFIESHRGGAMVILDGIDALAGEHPHSRHAAAELRRAIAEHPGVPVIVTGTAAGFGAAGLEDLLSAFPTATLPAITADGAEKVAVGELSAEANLAPDRVVETGAVNLLREALQGWSEADFDAVGNARGIVALAEDIVRRQTVHAFDTGERQWPVTMAAVRAGIDDLVRRAGLPRRTS